MTRRILVGFASADDSLPALRWGIKLAESRDVELTVVHATTSPVAIRNGPTSTIAHQLGNPAWATVHSTVQGLGAPSNTTTVVDHGSPVDVLLRHATAHDVIVLGPRRRRWFGADTQREIEIESDRPVLRISDEHFDEAHLIDLSVGEPQLVES